MVFAGAFIAGGLEIAVEQGQLRIRREGDTPKFVAEVEQRTFSGEVASRRNQPVLYVTERAVFQNFSITPELLQAYMDMVRDVVQRYYLGVTRYTTSAFLRAQLGGALSERNLAPRLYETAAEAAARLDPSKASDDHA